jgi:isocitrate/isopropylmalate dehydrogenase
MKTYNIVALPGDGIGPEVMEESVRILDALQASELCRFNIETIPCAGSYYMAHQREWPEGSFERVKAADAILLGAIGQVGPDGKPVRRADGELAGYEQVIGIRTKLDLYANMRPIKLLNGVKHSISGEFRQIWAPENVDLVVFRENTEGAYTSGSFILERAEKVETVISPTLITRRGAERVVRRAFLHSMRRNGAPIDGKRRVTCVDKSNVVRAHRFFRDIFREVAAEFPEVEAHYAYVDAYCHNLVRAPEFYDVCVAPNLPGDIVTDLGSVLQGGMGLAASGNIGDNHAMFEPVHGSAPDIAGQGKANPAAAILSVSLMLEWLGERYNDANATQAALMVEQALAGALANREHHTPDIGGTATTRSAGDAVCRSLERHLAEL